MGINFIYTNIFKKALSFATIRNKLQPNYFNLGYTYAMRVFM